MTRMSADEEARISAFVESYNAIDRFLRDATNQDQNADFGGLLRTFENKQRWWRDGRSLRRLANLRNAVVHNREAPYTYMAVPHPAAVEEIRRIERRLTSPRPAESLMHKNVLTVQADQTLQELLAHVAENDFSQFPVYDGPEFAGLVTENGVTRWLAEHLRDASIDLVEFSRATVREVLGNDESQNNYALVSQKVTAAEIDFMFENDPRLEAVLMTHSGAAKNAILAIATRWDVPLDADGPV